jgi:hypothetical protein
LAGGIFSLANSRENLKRPQFKDEKLLFFIIGQLSSQPNLTLNANFLDFLKRGSSEK